METVQKRIVVLLAAAVWLCAEAAAAPARFVILLDASPRMDPRRESIMRTVSDLIRTGFHDRIEDGDVVEVRTGASGGALMRREWTEAQVGEISNAAATIAGALPYSAGLSNGNLDVTALLAEDELSLFVLTDGFRAVRNTPFDQQVNAALRFSRDSFAAAEKPMLAVLLGQGKEWVTWSAHTRLGEPISLPERPARKLVQVEEPKPEPKVEPPPQPKEPESVKVVEEPPVAAVVEPAREPEPEPVVVAVAPPPAREPEPVIETKPEPVKVAEEPAPAPKVEPIVAKVTPAPPPARPPFPWPLLLGALACVAVAGLAMFRWLTKPVPVANSLISRSMDGQPAPRGSKLVSERERD